MLCTGLRLAQEAGVTDPTVNDAVWELMLEATETLKRLPDKERRWVEIGKPFIMARYAPRPRRGFRGGRFAKRPMGVHIAGTAAAIGWRYRQV